MSASPESSAVSRVRVALGRHYRVAVLLVITAAVVVVVTVMSLYRLPFLDGMVGAGGGGPCFGPTIDCGPGRTVGPAATTTQPPATPAPSSDPR
ncbi:hypothetical protein [Mycobacterium sp. Z3061]|uniref:hypothetical protein n=1 Tax=Mycobacterium sp. Z3061 TaxID=3073562 RepID=UPI003EC13FBC